MRVARQARKESMRREPEVEYALSAPLLRLRHSGARMTYNSVWWERKCALSGPHQRI